MLIEFAFAFLSPICNGDTTHIIKGKQGVVTESGGVITVHCDNTVNVVCYALVVKGLVAPGQPPLEVQLFDPITHLVIQTIQAFGVNTINP